MSSIHDRLDHLSARFAEQGLDLTKVFGAGPADPEVRREFEKLDLEPPKEVIEFFTWRSVISPLGFAGIFWETDYHSLGEMVENYLLNLQVATNVGPLTDDRWPGPRTRFPILMMDGSEIVSVECQGDGRGSVWFAFTEDSAFQMFPSLESALDAAIYCAHSGDWTWSADDEVIHADRDWMPWPGDLEVTPWCNPRGRRRPDSCSSGPPVDG